MTAPVGELLREEVDDFAAFGIRAFTTTRAAGSFSLTSDEPVGAVIQRWEALQDEIAFSARRLVIAKQVHGTTVVSHRGGWEGMLRIGEADGHIAIERGIALAVSVADCIPVFIAHESGAAGLLHAGWRGTQARILDEGIHAFSRIGIHASELRVHLGPAICGRCYEVSAEVRAQLTGQPVNRGGNVDLRSLVAEQAREAGVTELSVSPDCTRCDNVKYFSHRAGDTGRQLGVIMAGFL